MVMVLLLLLLLLLWWPTGQGWQRQQRQLVRWLPL
jgi:hypothetical protein